MVTPGMVNILVQPDDGDRTLNLKGMSRCGSWKFCNNGLENLVFFGRQVKTPRFLSSRLIQSKLHVPNILS